MSELSTYGKWKIADTRNLQEGAGELFSPEYATRFYDVDFIKLQYKKHFKVDFSCVAGADGVSPILSIYFTNKGIKKLLKTNQKMIDKVNNEYEELLELDRDYPTNGGLTK